MMDRDTKLIAILRRQYRIILEAGKYIPYWAPFLRDSAQYGIYLLAVNIIQLSPEGEVNSEYISTALHRP